jgi:predicted transcriptional regulator of viral defense system
MTGREKIIKYARERKVFRSSDIENELGLSRMYIWRLVQEGLLERVGYGLYSLTTSEHTEQQSILEIAAKMPSAVLCLLSALRFHDLTTQNPFEIWIAIPRGTRYPRPTGTRTRVFRFADNVYDAGIEKHILDGVEVKVYSPAKTVADCFYYQRKVGLDIALEALRDAWRSHKVTMDELYYYAEVRNIKSKMLPYLNTIA